MQNKRTIPKKIDIGSHLRVVAPSRNMNIISKDGVNYAKQKLEALGFVVSFGKHVVETGRFNTSTIESRISDLHEAFSDTSVDGVLTVIGGHNSNQLLQYIDYDLLEKNPKVLCGFSDITVLENAIYSKTGLVTYSGPHFSSWSMEKGFEYSLEYFLRCLKNSEPYEIEQSQNWSDDLWYTDQKNRRFIKNDGYWVLNGGSANGKIVGGNLSSLALLFGTRFMPDLFNSILMIEDISKVSPAIFDKLLQSLIYQIGFDGVRGLIIGRFQNGTNMSKKLLQEIIKDKEELKKIPILANFDIGHTTPIITFPIGGKVEMQLSKSTAKIRMVEH